MTVGRNEPCPCGSNKKYKNCHAGQSTRGTSKGLIILLAVIGVIAAIGAVASIVSGGKRSATPARSAAGLPATPGRPQPGPAPPGQVWSTEHGHWHDARTGQQPGQAPARQTVPLNIPAQTNTAQQQFTPGPQPPGPVPPGKVWSTEHGHWHDAPK